MSSLILRVADAIQVVLGTRLHPSRNNSDACELSYHSLMNYLPCRALDMTELLSIHGNLIGDHVLPGGSIIHARPKSS